MQRKFVLYLLLFFLPVIGGYLLVEYLSRSLASPYGMISRQLDGNSGQFEIMVLGSSQMKDGINPEFFNGKLINLASGDQHHNTDRKLYLGAKDRLVNTKVVVLEVSYSHFELPHNSADWWKNSIFLEYYGINCFGRPSWFKDRLLYLSNPEYFSDQLINHHITQERVFGFNKYGFDTLNYYGRFKRLDYDEERISETNFKINKVPDLDIYKYNSAYFVDFVSELIADGKSVVIVHPPMYKSYLPERNTDILGRRDSTVAAILSKYPEIKILDLETDTTNYTVRDYYNQSHLNPGGARKFSKALKRILAAF